MTTTVPRIWRLRDGTMYPEKYDIYEWSYETNMEPAIWNGSKWIYCSHPDYESLMQTRKDILADRFTTRDDGIEVNAKGGRQSALSTRMDLLPANALIRIGEILKGGADKYGVDNWRKIPAQDHVNHVLEHTFKWLEEQRTGENIDEEDQLAHAATRLLLALEISLVGEDEV